MIDTIRFETDDKYYLIDCYQDMLDDLVVVCTYGSKHSRSTQRKIIKVDSLAAAENTIASITKVRYRHGYDLVQGQLL